MGILKKAGAVARFAAARVVLAAARSLARVYARAVDPYRTVLAGRGPCPHCGGALRRDGGVVRCGGCLDEFVD